MQTKERDLDQFRTQLALTTVNEQILDQWTSEQARVHLAEEVLSQWSKMQADFDALKLEHLKVQNNLQDLEAYNQKLKGDFISLLAKF